MPAELKPNFKRKHAEKSVAMKTKKLVNVEETLKALEQKESSRKKKQQTTKDENNRDSDEEKVIALGYFLLLNSKKYD